MYDYNNGPSSNGHIDLAPPGSIEADRQQALRLKAEKDKYQSTIQPYQDKSQLFADEPAPSLKQGGIVDGFTSFKEWLSELFWGKEEKKIEAAEKNGPSSAPISAMPRLPSPKIQNTLKVCMQKMTESLEEMQEALKQDFTSSEMHFLYGISALLKKVIENNEDMQVLNREGVLLSQDQMREIMKKCAEIKEAMDQSAASGKVADIFSSISKFLLAATVVVQIASYASVGGAPLGVAASLLSVALLAMQGTSTLVKLNYDDKLENKNREFLQLTHERGNHDRIVDNYNSDLRISAKSINHHNQTHGEIIKNYNNVVQTTQMLGG